MSYFSGYEDSINIKFIDKIKLAFKLFSNNNWKPKIRFSNGVEIDLDKKEVVLNEPTKLHCKENFELSTEKHLLLSTSQENEEERTGYKYSVWFNPVLDDKRRPIRYSLYFDENTDEPVIIETHFDKNGNIIAPKGYKLESEKMRIDREREKSIKDNLNYNSY